MHAEPMHYSRRNPGDARVCARACCQVFPWFTVLNYRWALMTIWTRCVSVKVSTPGGEPQVYKALSPFFDMFNHDVKASVLHGLRPDPQYECGASLAIETQQGWKAGQEVMINYGPEPNSRLLMIYGFAIENNPYDCVDLWATLTPQAPDYDLKHACLKKHDVNHDTEAFKLTVESPVPAKLISALRVQVAGVWSLVCTVCIREWVPSELVWRVQ